MKSAFPLQTCLTAFNFFERKLCVSEFKFGNKELGLNILDLGLRFFDGLLELALFGGEQTLIFVLVVICARVHVARVLLGLFLFHVGIIT